MKTKTKSVQMNDIKLKKEIEDKLREVFTNGLSQGTKAICGVVLEEINSVGKTDEEKLKTLKLFCEKSLALKSN